MMGATFAWNITPTKAMMGNWDRKINLIRNDIVKMFKEAVPEIEKWMRDNAPWDDRTFEERGRDKRLADPAMTNARESLYAKLSIEPRNRIQIEVGYANHVYYSFALEYAMASQYEILAPTMDHWMPILTRRINEMLKRKYGL